MNAAAERERLSQAELLARLRRDIPLTEMVTVYQTRNHDKSDHGIYCALVPNAKLEESLSDLCWDLCHGDGLPGACQYSGENGKDSVAYLRFGDRHAEPLVIDRVFHGMRPDYVEISEEFRFFHRLYHDRKTNQFIKINDDGTEHLVAVIEPGLVKIRLKEIRQFLAIKEVHLAILFDCREHSSLTLAELGLKEEGARQRDGLCCWALNYGDLGDIGSSRAFSRLLGKRFIPPLPKEKSGFWGFAGEEPKKCVDFIIGVDQNGNEILHASDEGQLSNYFGANPGRPNYLTPVHFRKSVLDKYYQQPGKYSVEDGYLRCGGLWGMTMDNHHEDQVVAWLGDLGRDLPYEEQLHWRSNNILPQGSISQTFYRRQLLAQSSDSDQPDHIFKCRYQKLQESCGEKLGWPLLLPLAPEDAHYFKSIRVPASDEQRDFDDLVLALTKILVDSINEKELVKFIPAGDRDQIKGGISRLDKALAARGLAGGGGHIRFLRHLQDLRSSGAAHRKGSNYWKITAEFSIDSHALHSVFEGILTKGVAFLEYLDGVVNGGGLGPMAQGAENGGPPR